MADKNVNLTATDMNAIHMNDAAYINDKGAKNYCMENYAEAVEYYRLAAAMGNVQAISNLGYCYLYGREIEKNLSLAIGYFKIAALRGSVDAAYKLGDIYGSDKWGVKDKEMAVYYYRIAASFVIDGAWENADVILWCDALQQYPSLCYALGRELSRDGDMLTDLDCAYQFLKHAEIGYERELHNGSKMYEQAYEGVQKFLADAQFDDVRDKYDEAFGEAYE